APDGSPRSTHQYPGLLSPGSEPSGGFSAVAAESTQYGAYSLASDGSLLGHVAGVIPALGTGMTATDPSGGLVVVTAESIESIDAQGQRRWSVPIGDIVEKRHSLGVDVRGEVLLLFDSGNRFANTM